MRQRSQDLGQRLLLDRMHGRIAISLRALRTKTARYASCCLPPTAPRRPALTPSHMRRAQKKSHLRTSCEPLGLPRARASGLCRGLAERVRGGVAGPRLATAAATPSTAGVASLTNLRQRKHPFQLGGLPGPPPPLIHARGCSSLGQGWEQGPAPTSDFISQA